MRRRAAPQPKPGALPPELAIGKCIEVWAAEDPAPWVDRSNPGWGATSTQGRYSRAFNDFAAAKGLDRHQRLKLRRTGAPFSIEYIVAQGRIEHADSLLAKAGVQVQDLPALRQAALKRIERVGRR